MSILDLRKSTVPTGHGQLNILNRKTNAGRGGGNYGAGNFRCKV